MLLLALMAIGATAATTYSFLNVTWLDETVRSVEATGLKITFDGTKAIFTTADGTTHEATVAELASMEFSNTEGVAWDDDHVYGDVNDDGSVDGSDINVLVDIILGKNDGSGYPHADVNADGNIDVIDINIIIKIILGNGN